MPAGARTPHVLAVDDEHGRVGGGGHARQGGGFEAVQQGSDGGRRWGGARSEFGAGGCGFPAGPGCAGARWSLTGRSRSQSGRRPAPRTGRSRRYSPAGGGGPAGRGDQPPRRQARTGGRGHGRLRMQRSPCGARDVEVPDLLPGLRCHVQGACIRLTLFCEQERCCPSPTLQYPWSAPTASASLPMPTPLLRYANETLQISDMAIDGGALPLIRW